MEDERRAAPWCNTHAKSMCCTCCPASCRAPRRGRQARPGVRARPRRARTGRPNPGAAQEIGDRQRPSNPARWEGGPRPAAGLAPRYGIGGRRPAVLVRDPGDPSKMPAYFVLLDCQATVSSASEISFRTSKLAMSRKPIIYRKRPILLPGGGGVSVGKHTHVRVRALESRKGDRPVWSRVDEYRGGRASVDTPWPGSIPAKTYCTCFGALMAELPRHHHLIPKRYSIFC
jgi:hypothetical protein